VLVQILMDEGDSYAEEGEKARIDGLTGIPNRRRLDEFLLKEWDRHKKLQQPLSLLLCDVDYFKELAEAETQYPAWPYTA
jgi:PleD family two-component response regulator